MYYILNKKISLRKYNDPMFKYMYYIDGIFDGFPLKKENFEFLKDCDGLHDIETNTDFRFMCYLNGTITECEKGKEKLEPYQYMECDNNYFPGMNLMLTGKCNYNCLHCFNAKDNERLQSEWDINELNKVLDDVYNCGIHAFTITGGEPLLYPHFLDVVRKIYSNHMYVQEINTNGYFINEELLQNLKDIGCHAAFKISFDGLRHHDYLRNFKGAEEIAIKAIKLCIKYGFETRVQMNIHKNNVDTFYETLDYMDSLGVKSTRIIRTTEAPRWVVNNHGESLTFEEYYDLSYDLIKKYIDKTHNMDVVVWQVCTIYPKQKKIVINAVKNDSEECSVNKWHCTCIRGLIALGANGSLYPCLQMSGYYEKYKIYLGNVKKEPLKKLLSKDSAYVKNVSITYKDIMNSKGKCSTCKYMNKCVGGCYALAMSIVEPKEGFIPPDLSKCVFFEKGYYDKFNALKDEINKKQL